MRVRESDREMKMSRGGKGRDEKLRKEEEEEGREIIGDKGGEENGKRGREGK